MIPSSSSRRGRSPRPGTSTPSSGASKRPTTHRTPRPGRAPARPGEHGGCNSSPRCPGDVAKRPSKASRRPAPARLAAVLRRRRQSGAVLARRRSAGDAPAAGRRQRPLPRPSPPSFVGRRRAPRCHPGEAAAWTGSHHHPSRQEATPGAVLGDFGGRGSPTRGPEHVLPARLRRVLGSAPTGRATRAGDSRRGALHLRRGAAPAVPIRAPGEGARRRSASPGTPGPEPQGGQRWFHLYPAARVTHERSPALDAPPPELERDVRRLPLDGSPQGLRPRDRAIRHHVRRD